MAKSGSAKRHVENVAPAIKPRSKSTSASSKRNSPSTNSKTRRKTKKATPTPPESFQTSLKKLTDIGETTKKQSPSRPLGAKPVKPLMVMSSHAGSSQSASEEGPSVETPRLSASQKLLVSKRGLLNVDDGFTIPSLKRKSVSDFLALVNRRTLTKLDRELLKNIETMAATQKLRKSLDAVKHFGEQLWVDEEDSYLEEKPLNCHAFLYWRFRHLWKQSGFDEPYVSEPPEPSKKATPASEKSKTASPSPVIQETTRTAPKLRRSFKGKEKVSVPGEKLPRLQMIWQDAYDSVLAGHNPPHANEYPDIPELKVTLIQSHGEQAARDYARVNDIRIANPLTSPSHTDDERTTSRAPSSARRASAHPPKVSNRPRLPSHDSERSQSPTKHRRLAGDRSRRHDHIRSPSRSPNPSPSHSPSPSPSPSPSRSRSPSPPPPSPDQNEDTPSDGRSHPLHGPVSFTFNRKYLSAWDRSDDDGASAQETSDVRNPFWRTMPGPEVWHRRQAPYFPYGETPFVNSLISERIQEDLDDDEEGVEVIKDLGSSARPARSKKTAGKGRGKGKERARDDEKVQTEWEDRPPPFALPRIADEEVLRAIEAIRQTRGGRKRKSEGLEDGDRTPRRKRTKGSGSAKTERTSSDGADD